VFDRTRARRRGKAATTAEALVGPDDHECAVLGLAKEKNVVFGSALALVVTDHALVVVGRSAVTLRRRPPRSCPRSAVTVKAWKPRSRWSTLTLGTAYSVLDLRVDRIHHEEAAEIADLLRSPDSSTRR